MSYRQACEDRNVLVVMNIVTLDQALPSSHVVGSTSIYDFWPSKDKEEEPTTGSGCGRCSSQVGSGSCEHILRHVDPGT